MDMEDKREVSSSEAEMYAKENSCIFFETSAKTGMWSGTLISNSLPRCRWSVERLLCILSLETATPCILPNNAGHGKDKSLKICTSSPWSDFWDVWWSIFSHCRVVVWNAKSYVHTYSSASIHPYTCITQELTLIRSLTPSPKNSPNIKPHRAPTASKSSTTTHTKTAADAARRENTGFEQERKKGRAGKGQRREHQIVIIKCSSMPQLSTIQQISSLTTHEHEMYIRITHHSLRAVLIIRSVPQTMALFKSHTRMHTYAHTLARTYNLRYVLLHAFQTRIESSDNA